MRAARATGGRRAAWPPGARPSAPSSGITCRATVSSRPSGLQWPVLSSAIAVHRERDVGEPDARRARHRPGYQVLSALSMVPRAASSGTRKIVLPAAVSAAHPLPIAQGMFRSLTKSP